MTNPLLTSQSCALHGYTIIDQIGRGGYGTVFRAKSSKYDEEFCIKIVKYSPSAEMEVNTLMKLSHPNIILMYDYFIENDTLFIVLEYCPYGTLTDLIAKESHIRMPKLRKYMSQILSAVEFCHQNNVAHRDIKPSNVLVDKYGRLKIGDFGISVEIDDETTDKTLCCGSLLYMSPELINRRYTDLKTADVWALGITFYQMAFGSLPWPECDKEELKKYITINGVALRCNINQKLSDVLHKMFVRNPDERIKLSELIKLPFFTDPVIELSKSSQSFLFSGPKSLPPNEYIQLNKVAQSSNNSEINVNKAQIRCCRMIPPPRTAKGMRGRKNSFVNNNKPQFTFANDSAKKESKMV